MPISNKTRKILWGRAANRCGMCRRELVIDATPVDDDSVVGEECHIISGRQNGPRYDPDFPIDQLDSVGNLILLCRIHHKLVDDQHETYTVQKLQGIKTNHEEWVSTTLSAEEVEPIKVRRIKGNTPTHLVRLNTGRELLDIISGAYGYAFDNDEPESEVEAELLAAFLQEAQDWGDISDELEAGDRVKTAYRIGEMLNELNDSGFWVFGAIEVRRIEGGVGTPSPFPIAVLRVIRSQNSEIVEITPETVEAIKSAANSKTDV